MIASVIALVTDSPLEWLIGWARLPVVSATEFVILGFAKNAGASSDEHEDSYKRDR